MLLAAASLLFVQGCATDFARVDTSALSKPSQGQAGVYFFRQRVGPIGVLVDSHLAIDGKRVGSINNGDYIYLELPAGKHKYLMGSLPRTDVEVNMVEGENYFFEGSVIFAQSQVFLVSHTRSIELAAQLIKDGWYKKKG